MNALNETPGPESHALKVSVRAWLIIGMTLTVCGLALAGVEVKEPLYSGFLLGLGFYFGQKLKPQDEPK